MKSSTMISKVAAASLLALAMSVSGCITDVGTTETGTGTEGSNGGQSLPPPDFTVPPADPVATIPPVDPLDPPVGVQTQGFKVVSANPTKEGFINLEITGVSWPWMKIGFDAHCGDGELEIFTRNKTIQIPANKMNRELTVSMMFDDGDSNSSLCYTAKVVHDNQGPTILLKRYPAPSIEEGTAPEVEYEISDLVGVDVAGCSLNGIEKGCPSGGPHVIKMSNLPVGSYNFVIHAKDKLGNESQASVPWEVVSAVRNLAQTFEVKNQNKVDVLMIIDNSGSMEYEQRNMAARTSNLLSILRGLDYRIGVTTTDPRDITLGDGRLVPIKNMATGSYILTSAMPEAEAGRNLAATLQRTESGSGSEQAIYATYRALERSVAGTTGNKDLIRPEAQFAAVVISDEDESANGPKNDPHNLIKYIGDTFGGQKNFSFHSIITRPGDTSCKNTYGYSYGERYKIMSELTGGILGSVCEQDYAAQIAGIANGIRNLLKTMTLECQPIAGKPITFTKDGVAFDAPYVVEGVNIRFATELATGTYKVNYTCLK